MQQKMSPVGSPTLRPPQVHVHEGKTDMYVNHLFGEDVSPGLGFAGRSMVAPPFMPPPPVTSSSSTSRIGARPRGASAGPPPYARAVLEDEGSQGIGSISGSDSGSRASWECEPGLVWHMHHECGSPRGLMRWGTVEEEPQRPRSHGPPAEGLMCVPGQLWKLERLDEGSPLGHAQHGRHAQHGDAASQGLHDSDRMLAIQARAGVCGDLIWLRQGEHTCMFSVCVRAAGRVDRQQHGMMNESGGAVVLPKRCHDGAAHVL